MRLSIRHQTVYAYDRPIDLAIQIVRLFPRAHSGMDVLAWRVTSDGKELRTFVDGHGNLSAISTAKGPRLRQVIDVAGEVILQETNGRITAKHEPLPPIYFLRQTELTEADDAIAAVAAAARSAGSPTALAEALMNAVRDRIEYDLAASDAGANAAGAWARGAGVAKDHAHAFLAAARAAGLPGRYISGYRFTGRDEDAAAHSWVEVFDPGQGWIGLDPANRTRVGALYVRMAGGLDHAQAAPVVGMRIGEGQETLSVSLRIKAEEQ